MYVYLILNEATGEHKIGKSKHPERRLAELQTASPGRLILEAKFKSIKPFELEKCVQGYFQQDHVAGEWFYSGVSALETFLARCHHFEDYLRLKDAQDDW